MNAHLPAWLTAPALVVLVAAAVAAESGPNGFDLRHATIPLDEILRGGPPRDGIPSIDAPRFEPVAAADAYLRDDDLVLSLVRDGDARAYPVRILDHHEIVNDDVGGTPVLVSYCPLCGTGMVFRRTVQGRTLSFGVSGLLYQSDVLMYDRETESLWSQLGRRAISGDLAGRALELLPSRMLRWRGWKREHPEGRVLSRQTGQRRDYARTPYARYERSPDTMFPVPTHRDDLPAKTWVYGIVAKGRAKAYREAGLSGRELSDKVGGLELLLRYDPASLALRIVDAASGEEIPHTRAYWFAWQAFHPETELYVGDPP
jgi:hypothetical protein